MSKNKRKNVKYDIAGPSKSDRAGRMIFTLIVLCVVALIFIKVCVPIIEQKFREKATEKAVDLIIDNIETVAGDDSEVTEFINNLSEEDKQVVNEIVYDHMDAGTVADVMGYVNNNDSEGLMKYASENLTEKEMQKLMELYNKYSD